jgi:hypothetical protein
MDPVKWAENERRRVAKLAPISSSSSSSDGADGDGDEHEHDDDDGDDSDGGHSHGHGHGHHSSNADYTVIRISRDDFNWPSLKLRLSRTPIPVPRTVLKAGTSDELPLSSRYKFTRNQPINQ